MSKKIKIVMLFLLTLFCGTVGLYAASQTIYSVSTTVPQRHLLNPGIYSASYTNAWVTVTPKEVGLGTNKTYISVSRVNNSGVEILKKSGLATLSTNFSGFANLPNVGAGKWSLSYGSYDPTSYAEYATWKGNIIFNSNS